MTLPEVYEARSVIDSQLKEAVVIDLAFSVLKPHHCHIVPYSPFRVPCSRYNVWPQEFGSSPRPAKTISMKQSIEPAAVPKTMLTPRPCMVHSVY